MTQEQSPQQEPYISPLRGEESSMRKLRNVSLGYVALAGAASILQSVPSENTQEAPFVLPTSGLIAITLVASVKSVLLHRKAKGLSQKAQIEENNGQDIQG